MADRPFVGGGSAEYDRGYQQIDWHPTRQDRTQEPPIDPAESDEPFDGYPDYDEFDDPFECKCGPAGCGGSCDNG